jgi:predicted metal-dependent enzyme (double-stranded beta helix superfamily)
MKAKTMNKLTAEYTLMTEIIDAVKKASDSGMSEEDVKAVLNRIVEVIDNEE